MSGGEHPATCQWCGHTHVFSYHCPYNLHGEPDPFKTRCAHCEETIGSNEPRVGDRFGNLYCDDSCKAVSMETLVLIAAENGGGIGA